MKKTLHIFMIVLCVYLALGLVIRLTLVTLGDHYSYSFVVGKNSVIKSRNAHKIADWSSSVPDDLISLALNVYMVPIGWIEIELYKERLHDLVNLGFAENAAQKYGLSDGIILYSMSPEFTDPYIIKDGGVHSLEADLLPKANLP